MSKGADPQSFGRLASTMFSCDSLIALEHKESKAGLFTEVDVLSADVIVRALKREIMVAVERGTHADRVSINGLDSSQQSILTNLFAVEHQHSRGAWFLPEKVSLKTGLVNLPSTFEKYPRFASRVTAEDSTRVVLAENTAAVFLWAIVEPLFEQLFLSFELRGYSAGTKNREDQLAAWASVDEIIAVL
jgi:hypothetical protein